MTDEELVKRWVKVGLAPPIRAADGWHASCPVHPPADGQPNLLIAQNGVGPTTTCTDPACTLADVILAIADRTSSGANAWTVDDPIAALNAFLNEALPRGLVARPIVATSVIKHGTAGEAYDVHLDDDRRISLGSARDLHTSNRLEAAFAGQANYPMALTPKDRSILRGLIIVAAVEAAGVGSQEEETLGWIADHLRHCIGRPIDTDDSEQLYELLAPGRQQSFIANDGRIYLRLRELHRQLRREAIVGVTEGQLRLRLKRLDFTPPPPTGANVAARAPGKPPRSCRYWISEQGLELPT